MKRLYFIIIPLLFSLSLKSQEITNNKFTYVVDWRASTNEVHKRPGEGFLAKANRIKRGFGFGVGLTTKYHFKFGLNAKSGLLLDYQRYYKEHFFPSAVQINRIELIDRVRVDLVSLEIPVLLGITLWKRFDLFGGITWQKFLAGHSKTIQLLNGVLSEEENKKKIQSPFSRSVFAVRYGAGIKIYESDDKKLTLNGWNQINLARNYISAIFHQNRLQKYGISFHYEFKNLF